MAELSITTDKLQHIYDLHAKDFGLSGNKNPQQLEKLKDAINSHVSDTDTRLTHGEYRGQDASLHYNLRTRNVIVTGKGDEVIAGHKVSPAQAAYIVSTRRLN